MHIGISSNPPAPNLHLFHTKISSFICQVSPVNALTKPTSFYNELTKTHLANLENVLYKSQAQDQAHDQPILHITNANKPTNKGKPLLEGLNLSSILPEITKTSEEMSPRHLNKLQRLLSTAHQEYSPRNHLGSKWREYHGGRDWVGLLDPLDENLRREVVKYGEFVQAAYHSFHSNPATTSPFDFPNVVLPDRTYRVTKSLHATSSIELPTWVDDVAPELAWMTQRSSWIGYVAVCDEKREIQRMGRRDIVIAIRGTATCLEWAENLRAQLVEMHDQAHGLSKVECGFLSLFKTSRAHVPSLAQSVVEEVQRLIEMYKGETLSITITGHSLGAALALLVADEISACVHHAPPVAVFSFGGPRVGNRAFGDQINSKNVKVLRIVNSQDVITKVPGLPMVEGLSDDLPLAYSHVGTELRVDTKMSPYLKPNADVACCHDLEAYLHLVDGFVASNCPFRANAKRCLVKLLSEQGSNVKRLYTRRAKSLSLNLTRQERDTRKGKSFRLSHERQEMASSGCLPSPS